MSEIHEYTAKMLDEFSERLTKDGRFECSTMSVEKDHAVIKLILPLEVCQACLDNDGVHPDFLEEG